MSEHQAVLYNWREDHKRGYSRIECSCGWAGATRHVGRVRDEAAFLQEWYTHLPLDRMPQYAVVAHDGVIETGQAYVSLEGEDNLLLAISTRFTAGHLWVKGWWPGDVSDLDSAHDFIFPASRVRYVESNPWWDRDDIWERDMPKPQEAEDEEARWREEPE